MKVYNVNQVAKMLGTNPETVRRWIRDEKLIAIQPSAKKDGIKVTDDALAAFVKQSPKFAPKYSESKAIGIGAIAGLAGGVIGGIVATALLSYFTKEKTNDYRISSEAFKEYLLKTVNSLKNENEMKKDMIRKTELEISENALKIEQYQYLLDNEELLIQELEIINKP